MLLVSRILDVATGATQQVLEPTCTASHDTRTQFFNQRIEQAKESAQTLENNGITYDSRLKSLFWFWMMLLPQDFWGAHKDCRPLLIIWALPYSLVKKALWSAEDLMLPLKTANLYVASAVDLMLGDSGISAWSRQFIASWIKFDENLYFIWYRRNYQMGQRDRLFCSRYRGTSRTYKRWMENKAPLVTY